MLFSLLSRGDLRQAIIDLLLIIPTVLLALSLHEAAHAYVAFRMGDRTAFNLGRVTANPAKHLDLYGSICMLIFGYGWAKPVPINPRNFKNPKNGMAITAIAGPVTNLLLGIIGTLLYVLTMLVARTAGVMLFADPNSYYALTDNETLIHLFLIILRFFNYFAYMNFVLAIYNMIPIPPFDGSRFFSLFLPTRWYFSIMKYERYYLIIVIAINIICSRVFNLSPFGWLADKLWEILTVPLFNLFM
ncbi:MAG: site-2 protease family protein [Clostridia bacterium]|nr:site-2 protease family protein [Clostridia bacterium]